jgi:Flp pilus assembly protein TadD
VQLNAKNGEAINDLFDYYLHAPGFLGGGLDKAEALLPKIRAIDPAEEAYALAQLLEARKDFHSAEHHIKRAAEMAPRSVGRVIDVARFLSRRGRFNEAFSWLGRAEKLAPQDPVVLFNRAQTYIDAKQNLATARLLLEQYLKAPLNPDLPSRAEVEKLLKQTSGGL